MGVGALSVVFVIPVFTDIFVPIGIGAGALSAAFAIPLFTDIFVPIGSGGGAKTIRPRAYVITSGTRRQGKTLSRTKQQHSKSKAQKSGQGSHAASLIKYGAGGASRLGYG